MIDPDILGANTDNISCANTDNISFAHQFPADAMTNETPKSKTLMLIHLPFPNPKKCPKKLGFGPKDRNLLGRSSNFFSKGCSPCRSCFIKDTVLVDIVFGVSRSTEPRK